MTGLDRPFRRYLSKAPEVTVFFWIVKILVPTAAGTVTDLLTTTLGLGLGITTMLMTTLVVALMMVQVSVDRYVPWLYWLVLVLLGILGTLVADNLVDIFGVSPATAGIAFAALLLATLAAWYAAERTLSIHTVDTVRREAFYWLTVLFTFALSATGGSIVYAAPVVAAWIAYRYLGLPSPVAFWICFVATGPLGAVPGDRPGLGFAFLVVIVSIVVHLSLSHRDEPSLEAAARRAGLHSSSESRWNRA
jgi:uncharacterized membrane-anchored protein